MTNADYIRSMSDDEMMAYFFDDFCPPEHYGCPAGGKDCKECWVEWLKQPSEVQDDPKGKVD